MVAKPNNQNIALYCDICGKPIYFNESYYEEMGKHICGDCMGIAMRRILGGDYND